MSTSVNVKTPLMHVALHILVKRSISQVGNIFSVFVYGVSLAEGLMESSENNHF